MALSEHEQRALKVIEASLAAEDPKFASALKGNTRRRIHARLAALAGVGFLLGMGALVGGIEISPILSVFGFVVMLASTILGLNSWKRVELEDESTLAAATGHKDPHQPFLDRLEERWRNIQDNNNGE